ncbi:hypothetical protein Barb7_00774 [Bacteroidales bacterium Barb7]|nr:hypothetical protein Barb7_00774 [Bacteroidales bacterium Barb7]
MKSIVQFVVLLVIAWVFQSYHTAKTKVEDTPPAESKYYFDGSISREVLENYLNRSVMAGYFLVFGTPEGYFFFGNKQKLIMSQQKN